MWQDIIDVITFNFINGKNVQISLIDLIIFILVISGTSVALKFIQRFFGGKLPAGDRKRFNSVFQIVKYIIYLFVIALLLNAAGVNLNVFLTASAALFVGLGFALQTFFQDIISGVLIILDQSLHVGDIIEVDGKVGEVKEIKLRSTLMITRNDRVMIIPNHKFMEDSLFNWTQNHSSNREGVTVGVAYGTDVTLVEKLLLKSVEGIEDVIPDKRINVTFDDFGDSALVFTIHFYVINGLRTPGIQSKVRFKIYELFNANNIAIPFPQRDLHLISTPDQLLSKTNSNDK